LIADNLNTIETDGYALIDWDVEYQITPSISVYGGVDNVFQETEDLPLLG